jgi:hypothetical protein
MAAWIRGSTPGLGSRVAWASAASSNRFSWARVMRSFADAYRVELGVCMIDGTACDVTNTTGCDKAPARSLSAPIPSSATPTRSRSRSTRGQTRATAPAGSFSLCSTVQIVAVRPGADIGQLE